MTIPTLPSTLDILKNLNVKLLNKLVSTLNTKGGFLDESEFKIESTALQNWDESCTSYLINNGYTGGALKLTAQYVNGRGNVYVLYDSSSLNDSTAKKLI
ncbi:hypothetical protein TUM3794_05300 [Shewanella colwelliana]|uniref:RES domain-containing protein n=1 Tax=Shewanella colwelliana TaxID=23 RepID=A0ABQ4NV72_SHECO|nr:hypothetical protein [Shewanella colwelliana]GIU36321.1 hypothetical protein TUM3794_05300 [Shewanella colwelliana]